MHHRVRITSLYPHLWMHLKALVLYQLFAPISDMQKSV
jgi:hypothetical protein